MKELRRKSISCFAKDEGRPLEPGIQVQGSNNLKLLCSKDMVVSVKEKAGRTSYVCIMELNENVGLKKFRKREQCYQNQRFSE